jgi:FixJ family two-component response regulator
MGGVLLIDNDQDLLEALSDLIAVVSRQPCLALRSLAELLDVGAQALDCELAIVDINLGAGAPSGVDVYGWLRSQRFRGRIVFLTGHAHAHPLVQRACRLGHAQVLRKPIELNELSALILGQAAPPIAPRL